MVLSLIHTCALSGCMGADKYRDLRGALGAVVFDPRDASYRTAWATPPWPLLLASRRHDKKTYIAELEALAVLPVYSTYPTLFAGRRVQHLLTTRWPYPLTYTDTQVSRSLPRL